MNFIAMSPLLHFFCCEMNFSFRIYVVRDNHVCKIMVGSLIGRDLGFISRINIFMRTVADPSTREEIQCN